MSAAVVILAFAAILGWAFIADALLKSPRGDAETGLAWWALRLYARLFHRLRAAGAEHIPRERNPGPLIVVSNHTAGIDPLLIHARLPFYVRWMMARDMMIPSLEPLWRWSEVISVERGTRDSRSLREALRHLEAGGVVGIFPEGGLERPPREIRPFHPGVGMIVARSGAPVLPVIVEGTPQVNPAWASLRVRSRSRLTFHPLIHYPPGTGAQEITRDLHRRYCAWTGWPCNEAPRVPGEPEGA